jgi:hypothetical protein
MFGATVAKQDPKKKEVKTKIFRVVWAAANEDFDTSELDKYLSNNNGASIVGCAALATTKNPITLYIVTNRGT